MPKLKTFIRPYIHQFGYRESTGCLSAISLIKETILHYKEKNSNVFLATIDLSKAFDSVNIKHLIYKLKNTGMPESLINIIEYFYNSSYVRVKFNNVAGNFFFWKLGDGARQGGVLSAYLF